MLTQAGVGNAAKPVMKESDVVFMYGADEADLKAFETTWIAWGGSAGVRTKQVHTTGSFWCLTAGAQRLGQDPVLRDAVAKDIEGNPILVPWQLDQTYEGTPTWFGCTNNPAFRRHLDEQCLEQARAKPGGLHIDDPSGSYAPASYGGGCFCDHCMKAFRQYLIRNDSPALRREAGVKDFSGFDYREIVHRLAATKEKYLEVQNSLPLRQAFLDFNLQACVGNIRRLRDLARKELGPDMTLSVNAYYGGPGGHFLAFHPVITHMVAEVEHHAESGTARLGDVVMAYRQAETIGRPLAATGSGGDWARIKEKNAVNLVKVWIALGYACGQRLMVPHPKQQWCHTAEKGTHWYAAPVEEFAPWYRFVRDNAALFDGYRTIGPLAPPACAPKHLDTAEARDELRRALEKDFTGPLKAEESVWVFPRRKGRGKVVVHLVNTDYEPDTDTVRPRSDLEIRIPSELAACRFGKVMLHGVGVDPVELSARRDGDCLVLRVPRLDIWGVVEFRP